MTSTSRTAPSTADDPVTVVVPVYDRVRLLGDAVESVLVQDHDLELVIVDDGSTDGTGELADRLAASDPRVRVIHQANAGPAAARNTGLRVARHALVANQDSDDLMLPGRLRAQVQHLLARPDVVAVVGQARAEVVAGTRASAHDVRRVRDLGGWCLGTLMVHGATALSVGGYPEGLTVGEDTELLARLKAAGHQFATMDEVVYVRRLHDDNLTAGALDRSALVATIRRHVDRSREAP